MPVCFFFLLEYDICTLCIAVYLYAAPLNFEHSHLRALMLVFLSFHSPFYGNADIGY